MADNKTDDQSLPDERGLTTGKAGSGGASNDTGGLDAMGNELAHVDPDTTHKEDMKKKEDHLDVTDAARS